MCKRRIVLDQQNYNSARASRFFVRIFVHDLWKTWTFKADTHEGFCSRSMLQSHFARVSTHEGALFAPGACSQIFNRLNIVEHFAGWKFCSRGSSIPMKSLVHTRELCSRSVPLEHAPGAKSLVCIDLNTTGFFFDSSTRIRSLWTFRQILTNWKPWNSGNGVWNSVNLSDVFAVFVASVYCI